MLEPFKDSIAANLKEKRFVRGASTISMQLVKNLYLKRQKTIARKLEEMIITWLIEENRLVAKERMYEIYLNIIEWGPLVYGAQRSGAFLFRQGCRGTDLGRGDFHGQHHPAAQTLHVFIRPGPAPAPVAASLLQRRV